MTGRPLDIVCASTRQWNPGDEWIAAGIHRLFENVLAGRTTNWILYDRSPDAFVSPWRSPERRAEWMGNSYSGQREFQPDLLIAAGTPEWRGPHLQRLFDRHADGNWMFLGIGSGEGPLELGAEESILRRSLVTARDPDLAHQFEARGIHCTALPCPALFAAACETPPRQLRRLAVVLQNDRVENQRIDSALKRSMNELLPLLAERWEVEIVCNYIDEFLEFRAASVPIRYHYDSAAYEAILSGFDFVITTRLHSGILANSLMKPAVIVNPSRRVRAASRLLPFLYPCEAREVIAAIDALDLQATVRQLFNWKRRTASDYERILAAALSRYGLD
jgi:hypothetical protein